MATPETELLGTICEYLAYRKHFFWRSNNIPAPFSKDGEMHFRAMPKYSRKGVPDICLIKDGFFIGLELKPKGKYQSQDQKDFEHDLKDAGAEYYVIHSIEELKEIGL